MYQFELYKSRAITFDCVVQVDGWDVKVYTLSDQTTFCSQTTLAKAKESLIEWIQLPNNSVLPVYNKAFLIVHEAREGIWILFNWWTGGEMIATRTYFADYEAPTLIGQSPQDLSLLCIWELEIFSHERRAWINHTLKKAQNPDFNAYLRNVL